MKNKLMTLLVVFGLLLTSCGNSESAVQTAIAQTETAKPTATYTPTPTSTPTPTPPATATHTSTPTPTPTPEPGLSVLVLSADDFPDTYLEDISLEDMGVSLEDLSSEGFQVESFFAMADLFNFEIVMGFTTEIESEFDQAGFDIVLNHPEILIDSFMFGMGEDEASQTEELPEYANVIGDSSAGVSVVTESEGLEFRIDLVVFRNDSVGAFVLIYYLNGEEPTVPLLEIAEKFNAKIEEFLANQ
jgi:hypothetical protein